MADSNAFYIDIDRRFILNLDYSPQDKFVYAILKSMSMANKKAYQSLAPFSTEVILSMIGFTLNSKNKNSIKDTVDKLIQAEMIEVYEDFLGIDKIESIQMSKTYFVRVSDVKPPKYTRVYQHEMYKFMTMANKSKAKIFFVFIDIASYIWVNDTSDKYCYPKIESMEEETGVDRKVIMKYVKLLYQEKILYYKTISIAKNKDKNVYSRWEDREEIKQYEYKLQEES